jgi:hypothetical protein
MANCPKCDHPLTSVRLDEVTASGVGGKSWHAVAYTCPHCQAALSVAIDPIAVATDTVNRTMKRVGKILGQE